MAKKLLITIGGRIAALEAKETKGGDKFFTGRMVNSKSYLQNGEWKVKENWFSFTAFDKASVKYLEKANVGDKMIISADLEDSKKDNKIYYNLNILSIISIFQKEGAKHLQDVNSVIVIGKKYSDYELKNSFANGSIGIQKRVKSGETFSNETQWIKISAAGKVAEKMVEKQKGSTLCLEGELQSSTYENQGGDKVNAVNIFVTAVKGEIEYPETASAEQPEQKTVATQTETASEKTDEVSDGFFDITKGSIDDIPFGNEALGIPA